MWKDFFYYSRAERRGIALLAALMVVLVVVLGIRQRPAPGQEKDEALLAFRDSTTRADSLRRQARKAYRPARQTPVELSYFDPNRADSSRLVRLGLPVHVVRNVLKYRAKGGVFRSADAFSRIYGLSREDFERIRPYIRLQAAAHPVKADSMPSRPVWEARPSSVPKYAEGTVIDLNEADTADLKRIPGIGTVRAARIVAYRRRLGGFCRVEQLREIQGLPEDVRRWFEVKGRPARSLAVNRWDVERLRAHPYLNFYQAKVIVEHRHKYGRLHSLSQLALYEEFTQEDLERLEPYVMYE